MLPMALRRAALSLALLLPTDVQGQDDGAGDSVVFTFSDCAVACIELAGYITDTEDAQKEMCVASRDSLLETVEQCMLVTCLDGLSYVDEDLLTPMQTGCNELETPVSNEEVGLAKTMAMAMAMAMGSLETDNAATLGSLVSSELTLPVPTTEVESLSTTLIQAISNQAQSTVAAAAETSSQAAPTIEVKTITITALVQTTTEVSVSMDLPSTTPLIVVQPPSPSSTTVLQPTSTAVSSTSETSGVSMQTSLRPAASQVANGHVQATSQPAAQNPQLTSTASSAEESSTESLGSTTLGGKGKPTTSATSASSTKQSSTSTLFRTTASSTDDDSLALETGTPTSYTGTMFATSTTTSPTSSSSSSESSTSEDGIGGGSPFSTYSAAAPTGQVRVVLATLCAAVSIFALWM